MRFNRICFAMALLLSMTGLSHLVAQEKAQVKYWDQFEIGWPVPPEVLDRSPRPTKLRLFAAVNRGSFEKVDERNADNLQPIPGRSPGFIYTASGEGEVEFAVQLVYSDGRTAPTNDRLQADYRVIFDTRPPAITLTPRSTNGVDWSIVDDNLDAQTIKLECRWVGGNVEWYTVPAPRIGWSARDTYSWSGLSRESRTLEVRISASDKAGHKTTSRIVRLPSSAGGASSRDEESMLRGAARDPLGVGGNPDGGRLPTDIPNQPQIIYSNNRNLTIKSKLLTVTRSGVRKVYLFMKEMTDTTSGDWKMYKEYPQTIAYQTADPSCELAVSVPRDGRYGFIVIPESGAGLRDPDPRPTTAAHFLVEVDTQKPVIKIQNVTVSPGGTMGPRVEIEWDAADRNLMNEPITLEWAESQTAATWQPIAEKLTNARRYTWDVGSKQPYKFYIRARATDKATNTSEDIYGKEVNIDLERPSATIEMVKPGGDGAQGNNPAPAPVTVTPGTNPSGNPGGGAAATPSRDPASSAGVKVPDLIKPAK